MTELAAIERLISLSTFIFHEFLLFNSFRFNHLQVLQVMLRSEHLSNRGVWPVKLTAEWSFRGSAASARRTDGSHALAWQRPGKS